MIDEQILSFLVVADFLLNLRVLDVRGVLVDLVGIEPPLVELVEESLAPALLPAELALLLALTVEHLLQPAGVVHLLLVVLVLHERRLVQVLPVPQLAQGLLGMLSHLGLLRPSFPSLVVQLLIALVVVLIEILLTDIKVKSQDPLLLHQFYQRSSV